MAETLDQLHRSLQGIQALPQDKKVALLDRISELLQNGAPGSPKALEGIITCIAPILGSSQVIACQAALACIQPLIDRVIQESHTHATKALLHFILPQLLDRLGDGRMAIRELALTLLMSLWSGLNIMQCRKPSSEIPPSPTRSNGSRYSALTSSIPNFSTPFKSRAAKSPSSGPTSPSSLAQWNASVALEREIQTRGFGHKIWRVREMVLEWLHMCAEEYPEFPAAHYISNAFELLDDNQDSVRFASKRALNTIYNTRPELQDNIVSKAQPLVAQRPNLLLAITAPKGELAAMPASPYGGARSGSRLGSGHYQSARPGSRVSGSRLDLRPPQFPVQTQPPVPPLSHHHTSNGAFRPINYRSMSQQGLRPGSRTGFASPLSPGRSSYNQIYHHQQQQQVQSPAHSNTHMPVSGPSSAGSNSSLYSNSNSNTYSQSTSGSPPMQTPSVTSSLTNRRSSSMLNPRRPMRKQPSLARLSETFVPSQDVPAEVKIFNVPSKQSLASEFARTIGSFSGRETEDNWIHRDRAISLYRGIVWGNAAIEFHEDLVANLKENVFEILKAVGSLRTSMSVNSMGLCEDIATRLGPYAAVLFDPITDALLKQCAQTKKIGAQKAAKSLDVVFKHFPLRAKSVEALKMRMSEKSAVLRLAMVTTCTGILRSHGQHLDSTDRRSTEILTSIGEVIKVGIVDAQPLARESSRELFWELHMVSGLHGKKLLSSFPENIRSGLLRDKSKYVRDNHLGNPRLAAQDDRPMSAASILRTPSNSRARQAGIRPSFGDARESFAPSLMSVVAASNSQQGSPVAARSSYASDMDSTTSYSSRTDFAHMGSVYQQQQQQQQQQHNYHNSIDEVDEAMSAAHSPTNNDVEDYAMQDDDDEEDMDEDSLVFARPSPSKSQQARKRVPGLRTPVQPRMSLGLIDFTKVDMGNSLLEVDTPPRGSLIADGPGEQEQEQPQTEAETQTQTEATSEMGTSMDLDVDVDMEDVNPSVPEAALNVSAEMPAEHVFEQDSIQHQQSQATVVMGEYPSGQQQALALGQPIKGNSLQFPLSSAEANVFENSPKRVNDEDINFKDRRVSDCSSKETRSHCLTPERTPRMSPSPKSETRNPSNASMALFANPMNPMATPRTQTARYWYGPMDTAFSTAMPRPQVAESPMPAETPQRLSKIERYLKRLDENDEVDESLFRSLARFAKDESNASWNSESAGGSGYLERILSACLRWLQSPAENRDTVFTKDSCFDVLRVLVRRKSRHFTLSTTRLLLLEVLRNRFFESTILSGSAEDVFYDMATHLDIDLCFEIIEDFFQRVPLPPMQDLRIQRPGYAVHLESRIETPSAIDPMGVCKMDNALAGVLEFVAEVVRRFPSPEMITVQDLDRFMPYSVACFVHPRSQVRKAALAPLIVVHERLEQPDAELEELLLRSSTEQLAASLNPLAKYIDQLHRPELRKLVWTFYLSRRDH
ncbi:suppressor of tub2 mutation [Coemansia asiatica]|uniref:Suppressor of tub2 mutation n=1 Tax=Coemansia asiatica TaxID=1052880 RepID=A0A9W7XJU6_9FUNG|nr:suppressor of tub2 mutation [Coemansia asiatica]